MYDGLGLHMQLPDHHTTVPAYNKFYYDTVSDGTKQVHGACYKEGTGGHVFGSEAQVGNSEGDLGFQCLQYHEGGDVFIPE